MRGRLTTLNGGRAVRFNSQNLFPSITFTCEANVSKWIIGGRTFNDRDSRPEFQLWRLKPNTIADYQRVYTSGALAVVNATIADRVYEYPMDPPLTVQPGDVLGIYQPTSASGRLRIFYEEDVGAEALYQTISSSQDEFPAPAVSVQTHNHLPLVTVEVGMYCIIMISRAVRKVLLWYTACINYYDKYRRATINGYNISILIQMLSMAPQKVETLSQQQQWQWGWWSGC